jgi:hypothetical protein
LGGVEPFEGGEEAVEDVLQRWRDLGVERTLDGGAELGDSIRGDRHDDLFLAPEVAVHGAGG